MVKYIWIQTSNELEIEFVASYCKKRMNQGQQQQKQHGLFNFQRMLNMFLLILSNAWLGSTCFWLV